MELQRHTQGKPTRGNLLHTNQAKRQRIKKRLRLELAKAQREIYYTPNRAKRQRFKSCFAWNCKPTKHTKQGKAANIKKRSRLELQSHHTPSKPTKGNLLHLQSSKQNGKGLKSCFAWNCKGTHQANPQRKFIALQPSKTANIKKRSRLELQSHHTPSKPTRGNLLYTKQAKRQRIKKRLRCFRCRLKLQTSKPTKRQRFKSCFAWNYKGTHSTLWENNLTILLY